MACCLGFGAAIIRSGWQRLFHPGAAEVGHGDALLCRQLHDEAAQPLLLRCWCRRRVGCAELDVGLDGSHDQAGVGDCIDGWIGIFSLSITTMRRLSNFSEKR